MPDESRANPIASGTNMTPELIAFGERCARIADTVYEGARLLEYKIAVGEDGNLWWELLFVFDSMHWPMQIQPSLGAVADEAVALWLRCGALDAWGSAQVDGTVFDESRFREPLSDEDRTEWGPKPGEIKAKA